ncbi:helix-turn-helix transcriptional regulator [Facilibium subflavum]|uniref:helix-turn-helix transcriptional regulator n=1 Tax=Facilibium subflavum TaxID=2219058 RepID=UPI000E64C351|nr:hypothetical protein [Facilibium subflavum]
MPSFEDIQQVVLPKHIAGFEKLARPFIEKFQIKELILNKYLPNGDVYDVILYRGAASERYVAEKGYLNEPMANYKSMLALPRIFSENGFISEFRQQNHPIFQQDILYYCQPDSHGNMFRLSMVFDAEKLTLLHLAHQHTFRHFINYIDSILQNMISFEEFRLSQDFVYDESVSISNPVFPKKMVAMASRLTKKEIEVALMIVAKNVISISELANYLHLSYRMCEDYVYRLRNKLNQTSFEQLVLFLMKNEQLIKNCLLFTHQKVIKQAL